MGGRMIPACRETGGGVRYKKKYKFETGNGTPTPEKKILFLFCMFRKPNSGKNLFPHKLAEANGVIARVGLPKHTK